MGSTMKKSRQFLAISFCTISNCTVIGDYHDHHGICLSHDFACKNFSSYI